LFFLPLCSFGQTDTTFCSDPDSWPEPITDKNDFGWFHQNCLRDLDLVCDDPETARFYMEIIVEKSGALSSVHMIQKNGDDECKLTFCSTTGAPAYSPAIKDGKVCRFKGRIPVYIHLN
jgi:hypothetical protein